MVGLQQMQVIQRATLSLFVSFQWSIKLCSSYRKFSALLSVALD